MAQTPLCELHHDHEAAYIIGMVATGEQLFLCDEGAAHFGLTLALQTLDPAEIVNAAQAIGAKPAANGEGEPAATPARKRGKAKAPKVRPKSQPEPRLPQAPPAADDA